MISATDILKGKILIVDDREANVLLLRRMLQGAGYFSISSTIDPRKVCDLHTMHNYDLILLDLQMPQMNGLQVIEDLKKIEPEGYLPVLVITAQPDQKLNALKAGAKDFIGKPFELTEVLARVHNMLEVRLLYKQLRAYNDELEQKVEEKTTDLKKSYLETIVTVMRAAEYKDDGADAHLKRISHYSRALARLIDMDEEFADKIFIASPMHDIGKIGTPEHIAFKLGVFTSSEREQMKKHTTIGAKILEKRKSPYLQMGADIALNHHECWDGTGYPNGKQGEDIPLAARITNISDVYDALRTEKSYRVGFDHLKAVEIITQGDGRTAPEHFDPSILEAFTKNHEAFRDIYDTYSV